MQKWLLSVLLMGVSSLSLAGQDAAKIALIKRVYKEADTSLNVLNKYGNRALQNSLKLHDELTRKGALCLGYNPIWQVENPVPTQEIKVSATGKYGVLASFQQSGQMVSVEYTVECVGNTCKIVDVDGIKGMIEQCAKSNKKLVK